MKVLHFFAQMITIVFDWRNYQGTWIVNMTILMGAMLRSV